MPATVSRSRSRSTMSLCSYLKVLAKARRVPSKMLAWFWRSQMMKSPLPASAEMMPRLVWNPVLKTRAASRRMKRASRFSSSTWRSRLPLRKRDPEQPVPYLARASAAACLTRGSLVRPR